MFLRHWLRRQRDVFVHHISFTVLFKSRDTVPPSLFTYVTTATLSILRRIVIALLSLAKHLIAWKAATASSVLIWYCDSLFAHLSCSHCRSLPSPFLRHLTRLSAMVSLPSEFCRSRKTCGSTTIRVPPTRLSLKSGLDRNCDWICDQLSL